MSTHALVPAGPAATKARVHTRAPEAVLQRKCECGGSAEHEGQCEDCKKKKLQRRATGHGPGTAPPIVHNVLRSSGQPLDERSRSFFEPRFGHDFSKVRVHTDAQAHESASSVNALAYTVGQDLVFKAGQFAPGTRTGQRLLAHELTHVVQQSKGGATAVQRKLEVGPANDAMEQEADRVAEQITSGSRVGFGWPVPPPSNRSSTRLQRATADSASDPSTASTATVPPNTGLIVEDEAATVGPGQMRKTEFLDGLRDSVCAAADSELAAVGRTAQGCPFIERWIARLHARTSPYIERAIRKYAPESASATSARDYFGAVSNHVRQGVNRWATTGEISGVPPELMSEMAGGGILGALGGIVSGIGSALSSAVSGIGKLFTKAKDGGARTANPAAVQAQLGAGTALEGGVKARMETAFGHSFSRVRVHADSRGADLSAGLNARAFTIGNDVAFAAGEYRPGTLIGDALIAHELAHAMQQGDGASSGAPMAKGGTEYDSLEEDADVSAVGAMVSLWTGARSAIRSLGRNAGPRLRSGLRLQRCGASKPVVKPEPTNVKWDPSANCQGLEGQIDGLLGQALPIVREALKALLARQNIAGPLMKNFKLPVSDPRVARVGQVLQGVIESMEATAHGESETASKGTAPAFKCVPCAMDYGGTTYACDSPPVPLIISLCVQDGKLTSPHPVQTMIHEFVHASCGRTKDVVGSKKFLTEGTGVSIVGGAEERKYQKPQEDIEKNLNSAYLYAQFVMDVTGQQG